jgi:hypothetical protein
MVLNISIVVGSTIKLSIKMERRSIKSLSFDLREKPLFTGEAVYSRLKAICGNKVIKMKIFQRCVYLAFYILPFSLLGINSVEADPSFQTILAQTTAPTTTTTELTIKPPLTSQQKTTLRAIDAKYQPLIEAASQRYKNSLKALEALFGTNPSNDTIRNRYSQAKEARGELTDLLIDRALEFREVLSQEQKASMSDDIRRFLEKQ